MEIWITITLVLGAILFGIDYLVRRKKWKDNSKAEKTSLLVNMFSVGPYIFLSAVGMLWGLASSGPENTFAQVLYDATLTMGGIYFIIAFAAVILSFILRKLGKAKASIWTNVIAVAYIVVVLAVNYLVGML